MSTDNEAVEALAKERKIITTFVYPPIPVRTSDWCAYFDGDEPSDDGHMKQGWGRTEAEAIADLKEQYDE